MRENPERADHEAVKETIGGCGFLVGGLTGQKELIHRVLGELYWT